MVGTRRRMSDERSPTPFKISLFSEAKTSDGDTKNAILREEKEELDRFVPSENHAMSLIKEDNKVTIFTIGGNYDESSNRSTLANKLVIQEFEVDEDTVYQSETVAAYPQGFGLKSKNLQAYPDHISLPCQCLKVYLSKTVSSYLGGMTEDTTNAQTTYIK
jgi:hypothetical protein